MINKKHSSDAHEIACYYIELTDGRATKTIMSKTTNQAKSLLADGYTKKEIIEVIDYIVNVKHVDMYSFGYVNTTINSFLREIKKKKAHEIALETKREIASMSDIPCKEVVDYDTQRNKDKLGGFGIESRIREKYDLNMFERNGQDN